jgi:hypothetical protein
VCGEQCVLIDRMVTDNSNFNVGYDKKIKIQTKHLKKSCKWEHILNAENLQLYIAVSSCEMNVCLAL